jgi:hypothetical protein
VEINHEIEPLGAQTASEREIVEQALQPARPIDHDNRVEARLMTHHRFGRRFDQIGDVAVGEFAFECADGRRREHHVANQAKTNEKNLQRSSCSIRSNEVAILEPWNVGTLEPCYFSTVASSISITGMSSLIGYTR